MLKNIEAERARNGLSKNELAQKIGISVGTYYNWINEETDIPSSYLLILSEMFDVDLGYLLEGSKFFCDETAAEEEKR